MSRSLPKCGELWYAKLSKERSSLARVRFTIREEDGTALGAAVAVRWLDQGTPVLCVEDSRFVLVKVLTRFGVGFVRFNELSLEHANDVL